MDYLAQPLSSPILGLNYLGDVVFAVSGALAAGRKKMDLIGYVMIGTITGIGGGTLRDLLLGRKVWWTSNPQELILCIAASVIAYFFIRGSSRHFPVVVWLDAVGLAAFAVVGCHVGLASGASFVVAVFMGMLTATGGGVIRDVLTDTRPMILSAGELYATAALGGAFVYALVTSFEGPMLGAQLLGFLAVMILRGSSILYGVRTGPPGEFLRWGRSRERVGSD
jgi:uncharacterized membrane protein YeiH